MPPNEELAENTTPEVDPNAPATEEDLLAAVREAGGTASVRDAVADEAAAAGDPPVEPPVEEEPRIQAILRAREKATAEREAARNEADEIRRAAKEESDRLLSEARDRARKDWEEELANKRREFQSNPIGITKQLAGDTDKFIDTILRDGSPEARAMRELQAKLDATEQKAAVGEQVSNELKQLREQLQTERNREVIERVHREYMATATEEKAPYLNARYDADEIFQKANALATEWRQKGAVLGKDFDFDDVTKQLEKEAKERLGRLSTATTSPAHQVDAGVPPKAPGLAPKVPANGSRTLSAASGSERRTSPRPLSEMTPAEARQALIEEVAAARRANPGSKV